MLRLPLLPALLLTLASLATCASAQPADLTLDNGVLRTSLDPATGALTVEDLESGAVWRQPESFRDPLECPPGEEVVIPRAAGPIALDGDPSEWAGSAALRLDPTMLTSERAWQVDGEADLSAVVCAKWDDESVYVLFCVCDDVFAPGARDAKAWWEADSVEWWAGWDQAGYMLNPADPGAFLWGDWKEWAHVAVRPVTDFADEDAALALAAAAGFDWQGQPGYIAECSAPAGYLVQVAKPEPGRRFRFACGVNDADEPGKRSAQVYHPASIRHGSTGTYAVGVLANADGAWPEGVERAGPPLCSDATRVDANTLTYVLAADRPEATVGSVRCTASLGPGPRDLTIRSEMLENWLADAPIQRGFLPADGDGEYVIPYYSNGILVRTDDLSPPVEYLNAWDQLDMPGVGVLGSDGSALGILATHDYMGFQARAAKFGDERRLALMVNGRSRKGERLPEYAIVWHFATDRTPAAIAKRMRAFCEEQGWVRTLRDKLTTNPNLERLFGAPDVWGSNGAPFAEEARAAGIARMLVSGAYDGDAVRRITDLGYLSGEYDQYVDTDENTEPIGGVPPVPSCIRVNADGSLAIGWVVLDKSKSYYSRCSETALRAAQERIPRVLADRPYNARFEDVHTAMGLVECFSEEHPCDRTGDRENKIALLGWIHDQGLVLGGEHGRAWSVGVLDYQEGMMSCNPVFSWPAGHLVKVDSADQISEQYLEWGLGEARRVPFWELAFHDCVVSTWYWGDSIGYFEDVRPDLTDKKTAHTALYGAQPLMWATDLGLGFDGEGKERFLQAYRNACKVHEAVALEEMTGFEYLTADRTVQRTTFSGGATVTVNFGAEPARVRSNGVEWNVPQYGVVADGPSIHQHTALVGDARQTSIERPDYRFLDGHGALQEAGGLRSDGPLTVEIVGSSARVFVEPATHAAAVRLEQLLPDAGAVRLVALGAGLERVGNVAGPSTDGWLEIPCPGDWAASEALTGDEAAAPDLAVTSVSAPDEAPVSAHVTLANAGAGAANATVRAYWDAVDEARLAGEARATVAGGAKADVDIALDTERVDGPRTLVVVVSSGGPEVIEADNTRSLGVYAPADLARWPVRLDYSVDLGGVPRHDPVVEFEVDLSAAAGGRAVDPSSVRAALVGTDGNRMLPTQYAAGVGAGGLVSFALEGEWQGGESVRIALVAAPVGESPTLPLAGSHFDAATGVVTRATYAADVSRGDLRPVWFRAVSDGVEIDPPEVALQRVIFSSAETGWGEDTGELVTLDVLEDGPVRTVVRSVRKLPSDVMVTRTYTFYPSHFVVDVRASELQAGLMSRVWYGAHGRYEDSNGHSVVADASGKDEGVTAGNADPKWFSLRTDGWSHACIALTPATGVSYWDDGSAIGQCGFHTAAADGNRYAHVLVGPRGSSDFAREWCAALTMPPVVEAVR